MIENNPASVDAERCVLGVMLKTPHQIDEILGYLSVDDFYFHDHRIVFDAIQSVEASEIDLVTVGECLASQGEALDVHFLGQIIRDTPMLSNFMSYVNIVKDKSRRRQLISKAGEVLAQAQQTQIPTEQLISEMTSGFSEISTDNTQTNQSAREIMRGLTDELELRVANKGELLGLSTGLKKLDSSLNGLQAGKLYTIAARPAHGKSTLMVNIAEENALKGKKVQVFTLEMTNTELAMKMVSSIGKVDFGNVQAANLEDDEWTRTTAAMNKIANTNLRIDDATAVSMNQIRSRCRKRKATEGLDLILVDYLGLMQTDNTGNHVNDISNITRDMKNLAKDMDVPVVLLSQLNRECEKRRDQRPILSDLRDSGSIEQDSNVVMFIYRDEVVNEMTKDVGIAEILIRKNRGGKVETVRTQFIGKYQRFQDYTPTVSYMGQAS